jgi:hypothetical protein
MTHFSYYTGAAPPPKYSQFPKSNAHQFKSPEQRAAWRSMSTEQLANLLVSTVEQDIAARLYFSVHTKVRSIVYVKLFIEESMDRDRTSILSIIEQSYYPALVRIFAKWEKLNGRAVTKEDITMLIKNEDLVQATSELLLSWLELESRILFYENRQSKYKRLYGFQTNEQTYRQTDKQTNEQINKRLE